MSFLATSLLDFLLHVTCASIALLIVGMPTVGAMGPLRSTALLAVTYAALWLLTAGARRLYRDDVRIAFLARWYRRARVSVLVLPVVAIGALMPIVPATLGGAAFWAVGISALFGSTLGAWAETVLTPTAWQRDRAVLVGTADSIARCARRLDEYPRRVDVVGTLAIDATAQHQAGTAQRDDCAPAVAMQAADHGASVVVLTTDAHVLGIDPTQLVWALEEVDAVLVTDTGFTTLPNRRVSIERIGGLVTYVARRRARWTPGTTLSGLLQWCLAVVGLILISPVLATLALYIRLDSRGRAFYVQERIGRHGKPFRMYKFRTMIDGADQRVHEVAEDMGAPDRGPLFKAEHDHRITRAGRFLRRSSLDELPQLINVVRGQMRLIGPRPALPQEVAEYRGYEARRLFCTPGMTGLWQVSGRSNLDWSRSIELDQRYVDGRSLAMDAAILGRTPGAVISSRGAY